MVVLARLDQFNRRHPWSHNDHFGRWAAGQVAAIGAREVLDVGCGTGSLVDRLRHRTAVTGLEPDPTSADIAAQRFAHDPAVTIHQAGFAERDHTRRWDAITLVPVLHHLPLTTTLRELRDALNPGGRLAVVGCYRESGPADVAAGLVSLLANPIVGLVKHPAPTDTTPAHMNAPTAAAEDERELPGARIRRRLFWRYILTYDRP